MKINDIINTSLNWKNKVNDYFYWEISHIIKKTQTKLKRPCMKLKQFSHYRTIKTRSGVFDMLPFLAKLILR